MLAVVCRVKTIDDHLHLVQFSVVLKTAVGETSGLEAGGELKGRLACGE